MIAGGTGLIGSALAERLALAGREVVVLSRRAPEELNLVRGCRAVRWDGRTSRGWLAEAEGAAAIVNLAGETIAGWRWTAARKRRILASRLEATAAVVAAIGEARSPPRALLQASGVSFYGDRGDELVDESSAGPGVGFLAQTAAAWERASEPAGQRGTRRVLLRTGLVLARQGGALPKIAFPFRFGLGARLGNGRQWMPWIHLVDEVGAIEHLLVDESARGPFNLVAPAPMRNADFTRQLAMALRRPAFLVAPAFVLRLVLGEMALLVLGGQRAVPRRLVESGYRARFAELAPALADVFPRR